MTLTQAFPVFEGHNDVLLHLSDPDRGGGRNFFLRNESGHLDLPRAHQGGWAGGFFAIFIADQERDCCRSVSDEALDPVVSGRVAIALMARLFRLEEERRWDWRQGREAIRLGRRTKGTIRQNIFFGVGFTVLVMGLASFGLISSVVAAASQSVPDVGVALNASRLLRWKR